MAQTVRGIRFGLLVGHAALLAIGVRLFDLVILKRFLDRPAVVVGWLTAAFVAALVVRALSRAIPAAARGRIERGWAGMDRISIAYLILFLCLLGVQHFTYMRAASDGRAYFLQVRSLVLDHDLDFGPDVETFGYEGGVLNYALGTPLLWAPFFVAGHEWLGVLNAFGADYPRDGFFNPYQRAVGIGTLVYGFLGLLVIQRLLARYWSRELAASATIATAVGGFMAWYIAVDASWSHAVSMFTVTLFLYQWIVTRERRTLAHWAMVGALGGLMTMARWQNIFFFLVPFLDALPSLVTTVRSRQRDDFREWLLNHTVFGVSAVLAFFPQMLVWKLARSGWLDYPSNEHPIFWNSPHFWDALFHGDRGLLTWTPLLVLSLLGLLAFYRRERWLTTLLVAALIAQVYINGTLWWGDHGFGARRFENSTAILALGMAAAFDWMRRHPWAAPAGLVSALIALNLTFMADVYNTEIQQTGEVTLERMIESFTRRFGNPMSLPASAWFAWRYGGDMTLYSRIGSQTYNNLPIDVGGGDADRYLAAGWSGAEREGDLTFRWATGIRSHVILMTKAAAPYRVRVIAEPFLWPGGPAQTLELAFNGHSVGTRQMSAGLGEYLFDVPAEWVELRFNQVTLGYGHARSPASLGISEDARELSIRVDRIEFMRTE